jgi:outer membrane protein assembly factor BamD (BamD/ComL family)
MRLLIVGVVAATALLTAGCSRMTPEEAWTKAAEAEQSARKSLDTARTAVDKKKVFAPVLEAYGVLIDHHADSPQAEEALFRRAAILGNDTRDIESAIGDYKLYVQRYPESSRAPLAMFMVGYMYNNELGNIDSAAAAYKRFLARFPDNEMAPSAQFELNNLGKAPEELLPRENLAEEPTAKPAASAKK